MFQLLIDVFHTNTFGADMVKVGVIGWIGGVAWLAWSSFRRQYEMVRVRYEGRRAA